MAKIMLLLASVLVLGGAAAAPESAPPRVVVMTYNVHFRAPSATATIEAIRAGGADVVFLQETNARWERKLRRALADEYPHMEFRGDRRRAGGLAVLSRYPIADEGELLPSPEGMFPAWRLVIETPVGEVQALHVHLHPTRPGAVGWVRGYFAMQPTRLRELRAHAEHLADLPTIVVGDFNEHLGAAAVTWMLERGFASATEPFAPGAVTWRWRDVGWPLDHILHDERLRAVTGAVLDAGGSDHLPVVATLERAD